MENNLVSLLDEFKPFKVGKYGIVKSMFTNLWILVDIMIWFNVGVGVLNGDISTWGTGLIIYCIYYLICDQIRLNYRLRLLENEIN